MASASDSSPSGSWGVMALRLSVIGALMFWLGGFTFYAAVVIPTAHDVLGSHREVGFITQAVTYWINLSGAATAALLLIHLLRTSDRQRWLSRGLWATWVLLTAAQLALFCLHPSLDGFLDAKDHDVLDRAGFYHLHRIYLIIATVQWCAAITHVCLMVAAWRQKDRSATADLRPRFACGL